MKYKTLQFHPRDRHAPANVIYAAFDAWLEKQEGVLVSVQWFGSYSTATFKKEELTK